MAPDQQRTYRVVGMHCGSCALNVRDEVSELPGVDDVTVDLPEHRMTVLGAGFTDEQVRAAVERAGYQVPA